MTEIERVNALPMLAESAANWRFNLDGFVLHTLRKDLDDQFYTQVFRSGGIEAISGALPVKDERRGGFWAWGMEGRVIAVLGRFQQFWQSMGVTPPLVVGLTLAGVKGWKVLRGAYDGWDPEAEFDRDVVNPQEVVLSDLAVPADVVLSPVRLRVVWRRLARLAELPRRPMGRANSVRFLTTTSSSQPEGAQAGGPVGVR
jgi:hypothetical protein